MFVRALNQLGIGFFYRVKNMGTFDPIRKFYRKDPSKVAIPDICGDKTMGRAVYIECKRVARLEKKKKLIFKVKFQDGQKEFLLNAHRRGQIAGVAFNLEDAISIVKEDEKNYPRHPRTWLFLPEAELEVKAQIYLQNKRALAERNQDPIKRDIAVLVPEPEEDWERL